MNLEGRLNILLPRDPVAPARIALKEPADITRLLAGRSPEAASQIIPSLYSLCGTAHAAAAISAVESARGIKTDPETLRLRECLVLMERAREHLLRICLNWPVLLGEAADTNTAQAALKLLPVFQQTLDPKRQAFSSEIYAWQPSFDGDALIASLISLAESRVFGEEIPAWLDRRDRNLIQEWAGKRTTAAARFTNDLMKRDDQEPSGSQPLFLSESKLSDPYDTDAAIPETSSFERRRGHPVLTRSVSPTLADRYLARLVDLAETANEIHAIFLGEDVRIAPPTISGFSGVGTAETARGRLTHVVDLDSDRVADYKIISPTRWNFASRGVARRYLDAIPPGPDSARIQLADLVVGAIDPCVAYEVRIH